MALHLRRERAVARVARVAAEGLAGAETRIATRQHGPDSALVPQQPEKRPSTLSSHPLLTAVIVSFAARSSSPFERPFPLTPFKGISRRRKR